MVRLSAPRAPCSALLLPPTAGAPSGRLLRVRLFRAPGGLEGDWGGRVPYGGWAEEGVAYASGDGGGAGNCVLSSLFRDPWQEGVCVSPEEHAL